MNLLDVVLALTVILLLMSTLAGIMYAGSEKNIQKRAAEELQYVAKAAEHYAHRHHETLINQVTATTGRRITVQDLIDDNFLPEGSATQNVWGQDYGIYFRRVEATVPDGQGGTRDDHSLRVIVLTEGGYKGSNETVFNNRTIPGTLAFMPSGGGYVSSGNIPSQPANALIGTGWTLALASVGVPSPGPGHMGVVSTFNSPSMTHDYLYRVDVGVEELNTMETELHMNDFAILGTKEVGFIPHTMDEMQNFCLASQDDSRVFQLEDNGLYICRKGHVVGAPSEVHEILDTGNALAIKNLRLVSHGERITKPVCAPHTNSEPELFLSPVAMAAQTEKTPPITAFQTYAVDHGTSWQVVIRMQDAKSKEDDPDTGWRYPDRSLAMAHAITFCRSPEMASPGIMSIGGGHGYPAPGYIPD